MPQIPDEARKWFSYLIKKHPKTDFAKFGAGRILETYRQTHNWARPSVGAELHGSRRRSRGRRGTQALPAPGPMHSRRLTFRVSRARPGMRGWEIQELVCARLGEAGYPTPISDHGTTRGYVHGLGHGIGFELHEYPSFKEEAGEEGLLESGDVVTLEPGLYDPEAGWGVRIEDVFAVGDDGLERLTPLPDALDPRAW